MKMRSNMLSRAMLMGLGVVGFASAASAHPPGAYGRYERDADYARVVHVEPIVHRVRITTPDRECWNEDLPARSAPSHTEIRSTIVGGLIGAAVGHHVAMRTHDPIAVVGGSLIGAAIGNSIGADRAARRGEYRDVEYRTVERCEVRYRDDYEERVDGYRVTYVYHGREYTTRLPYDPGPRLRVNVAVSPDY